ncbi:hypothetical protein C3L33_12393, partial [Rhododendron williamsianum]
MYRATSRRLHQASSDIALTLCVVGLQGSEWDAQWEMPQDNRKDSIDYIPGVGSIKPTDLMSYLQDADIGTVVHRIIPKAFAEVKKADIIICNTVQELEPETISALHQKQPTYAIGPVFPTGFTKSPVATNLWPESDCTQWLDARPHGSVLYISFGSYAHTSKHDIVEIAQGLLLSGVGINLCDERPIAREKIADNINRLMSGKTSDELRNEMKKMRKTLEDAVATDGNGSSERNFKQFVNEVKSQPSPLFSPSLTPVTVACSLTPSSLTVAIRRRRPTRNSVRVVVAVAVVVAAEVVGQLAED